MQKQRDTPFPDYARTIHAYIHNHRYIYSYQKKRDAPFLDYTYTINKYIQKCRCMNSYLPDETPRAQITNALYIYMYIYTYTIHMYM